MPTYFEQRLAEIKAGVVARRMAYSPPPAEPKYAKPKKIARKGYVYFFRAGNAVKIGFTNNPAERSSKLQTACSERAFMVKFVKGTTRTEREFHQRFAEYRLNGEWFDLRGWLAKYLEMHFRPADIPAPVQPEPEPEIEFRF